MDLNADYAYSYLDIGSAYLGLGDAETALQWFQRGQGVETRRFGLRRIWLVIGGLSNVCASVCNWRWCYSS